ncbi:unnamed protein product [Auanema sp. JU1783]|nr:unnamed protein product [Auanema sp. JU1783]
MRYIAAGQWSKMPDYGISFLSVTVGCSKVYKNGGHLLYGLSNDGAIFCRVGINSEDPEGNDWVTMEGIQNSESTEDLVFVTCCSYYPTLIAGTWDGKLFWRWGIDSVTPTGIIWHNIPTPNLSAVIEATLGMNTLWVTTVEGEIWMHKLELTKCQEMHNWKAITSATYKKVTDGSSGRKRCLTTSRSDVLFCIGGDNKLELREGISTEESCGRRFVPLVDRTEEGLSWNAICATSCSAVPNYWTNKSFQLRTDSNFRHAIWRKEILHRLERKNEKLFHVFRERNGHTDGHEVEDTDWELMDHGWLKSSKVQIGLPSERMFKNGVIRVSKDNIEIATAKTIICKSRAELQLAEEYTDIKTICCLGLLFVDSGYYKVGFANENERRDWLSLLQDVVINCLIESPRDKKFQAAWSISQNGHVRCHPMNELIVDKNGIAKAKGLSKIRGVLLPGSFRHISAGARRIVWAINEDGVPYVLDQTWSPFQSVEFSHPINDSKTIEIREYQKNEIFRGFIPLVGIHRGMAAWMENDSVINGKSYRLPSDNWSWVEESWVNKTTSDCDEEGWMYATKLPGSFGKKPVRTRPLYRVRNWQRKAKYSSQGPWRKVQGVHLVEVHVQKNDDERILVWGVTTDGNVVIRQGVDGSTPEGCIWKHILCDYKIRTLAVESGNTVFAITRENKLLKRYCSSQTDMECTDWQTMDAKNLPVVIEMVAMPENLWFISEDRKLCLYYIKEGVYLTTIDLDQRSHISRDLIGSLYISSEWNTKRLKHLEINKNLNPQYRYEFESLVSAYTFDISIC